MVAWLLAVTFLFGRLIWVQRRFQSRLDQHHNDKDTQVNLDLNELRQRAGVTRNVRVIESDLVAAPAVWGITRPTIILPRAVASSLSPEQLQWVLLHELAHIQRCDLMAVAVQRFVSVLYFFNPAVWIANRVIHQLREYACDDLAVLLSDGSAIDSGEAFLQILRSAKRKDQHLSGAIGVFGFDRSGEPLGHFGTRAAARVAQEKRLDERQ